MLKQITPEEIEIARRYHRFYLALQLRDLCNEVPVHRVARKYDMPRGSVQNLAQTCQGFAAGMIKFCECMGWGFVATLPSPITTKKCLSRKVVANRFGSGSWQQRWTTSPTDYEPGQEPTC